MKNRILLLPISDQRGASARYRVYQYVPLLEAAGFRVDVVPPAPLQKGLRRPIARHREALELLDRAAAADLVIVQKRLLSSFFFRKLARGAAPYFFDLDDAIFVSPGGRRSRWTQMRVTTRLDQALRGAACVLAGNRYLADYAQRRAPRVTVLPTAVDVRRYRVKESYESDGLSLGWIGSRVTHPYLDVIQPVLADLSAGLPGVRLTVVSDTDVRMPGVEVVNVRWSQEGEATAIRAFDVGVMPLPDDPWTRGKCGLKLLQYMAAGVPAVASAVGASRDLVEHERSGFLCGSAREWRDTLARLAGSPALRREIGLAGRTRVERTYALEPVGARLVELVRSGLGGGG